MNLSVSSTAMTVLINVDYIIIIRIQIFINQFCILIKAQDCLVLKALPTTKSLSLNYHLLVSLSGLCIGGPKVASQPHLRLYLCPPQEGGNRNNQQ